MRLRHLHLIRYGKFTDTLVAFPKSEHDFHVIVGPNEAGKSTVRGAISDLLFGMPLRSAPMAFLHPQPELRLGALVENAADELEFHRTKATKSPLRTPADVALVDSALAAYLGTADRAFFEQMFGLDHTQMVKGGESILDASKDVGQVLFQSAAGIASLGKVRDELIEEAGKLWAPRKANDRAYYAAAARLEEASQELKVATVRTRSWTEAQAAAADVDSRLEQGSTERKDLETNRAMLERVRRLAPFVQTLRAKEAELAELGDALELPADAAHVLSRGESALAAADEVLKHREADVLRLQADKDASYFDREVLSRRLDIETLESFRHRVRDHAGDLVLRKREVEQFMDHMRVACAELGWSTTEAEVRAALPTTIALRTVTALVKDRGALRLAKTTAADAAVRKERDLAALRRELGTSIASVIPEELRTALGDAQALKNSPATQRALSAAVAAASQSLREALAALGHWSRPVDELREMSPPSIERVTSLRNERTRLASAVQTAVERSEDAQAKVEVTRLAVEQYVAARRVVTVDDVRSARDQRDDTWVLLKSGATTLAVGAPALDAAISLADELVDTQLGSATEAAELQSLRQQYQRDLTEREYLNQLHLKRQGELERFDRDWFSEATTLNLKAMMLEDVAPWLGLRDAALSAATSLVTKEGELERERDVAAQAIATLHQCLRAAGVGTTEGSSLVALCAVADKYVKEADAATERRKGLTEQVEQGEDALEDLREASDRASQAYEHWKVQWAAALAAAMLGDSSKTVEQVEAALEQVTRVTDVLDRVDAIRRDRIDTMNQELERFERDARVLVNELAPELATHRDVAEVSKRFGLRLAEAVSAQQRWTTADLALATATQQRNDAKVKVQETQATLGPLMDAAGVVVLAEARPLVERSDRKRQLAVDIEAAKNAVTMGADGLSLIAAIAEVDKCEIALVPSELEATGRALQASTAELATLTEARLRAKQSLDAVAGQANAAIAEAKRQEALAAMAEASERFLKVATASKLLRWAIDRYRERKQGPMLSRASEIFGGLTLGRFKKLLVDYDKEPLSLAGQRSTGEAVDVSGMSEGTRDQLFLALRLAALELHLQQGTALPFIADDLFINFDDERATAGLRALKELSRFTQVIFLSHHDHLVPAAREVFGPSVNIVSLSP